MAIASGLIKNAGRGVLHVVEEVKRVVSRIMLRRSLPA